MKLKIAEGLSLPLEFVTQTAAILAKRRAGKSYTMRRIVEQLFKAGQQTVLMDPKGDQWGLRSSADGKAPGLPFIVLGGERADVPLEPSSGDVVARLVVEQRVSIVLDLSLFRKHEVATFSTAFLENLYRLKAREMYRTPMMLVIDEADAIAPQKPQDGEARMLGAAEDIVRRGGQRGIGCVLVTQRSAVLNKNVLTQAEVLVALRTIAPQDLAAMNAWIDVHGEPEQRKTLMESLPSLPVGDAWFWSPGWPTSEGIFKRVHVLPIETFDSGKSPEPGEKRIEPKNLADVDLEALKKQMSATIEKAKADDPKELRKKIAELQQQLKQQPKPAPATVPEEKVKIIEKPVFKESEIARLEKMAEKLSETGSRLDSFAEHLRNTIYAVSNLEVGHHRKEALKEFRGKPAPLKINGQCPATHPEKFSKPKERAQVETGTGVDEPQRKILSVALMLVRRGITPSRESIARWLDIHPNGGRYGTNMAYLRQNNYIQGCDITSAGEELATELGEGLDAAKEPLDGSQREIIDILAANSGVRFTRETLAEQLGIHPNGGRYGTNLARLRTMGLIPERGDIYLTEAAYK